MIGTMPSVFFFKGDQQFIQAVGSIDGIFQLKIIRVFGKSVRKVIVQVCFDDILKAQVGEVLIKVVETVGYDVKGQVGISEPLLIDMKITDCLISHTHIFP